MAPVGDYINDWKMNKTYTWLNIMSKVLEELEDCFQVLFCSLTKISSHSKVTILLGDVESFGLVK